MIAPRTPVATVGSGDELAPPWHTALLVGLMLTVALVGMATQLGAPHPTRPIAGETTSRIPWLYLPALVVEWGLTLYVCRIGRPRNMLGSLLGKGWTSVARAAGDLGLALTVFVVIDALELGYARTFGATADPALSTWLPRGVAERLTWIVVATSAGLCEEVVYRGYLETQLSAFTRRPALGVALQAALFGLAHGERGLSVVARFALHGAILGALARMRGSLVPGIVCHVVIDLTGGLAR